MKKKLITTICLLIVIAGFITAYYYWTNYKESKYLELATEYKKEYMVVAYSTQAILLDYQLSGMNAIQDGNVISNSNMIPIEMKPCSSFPQAYQIRQEDYKRMGIFNKLQEKSDLVGELLKELKSICPNKYENLQKEFDDNYSILIEFYTLLKNNQYSLLVFSNKYIELGSKIDKGVTATDLYVKVDTKSVKDIIRNEIIGFNMFMNIVYLTTERNFQGKIFAFY